MNTASQRHDDFGFYQAAKRISEVDLTQTMNHVSEECRRSAALLRSLHCQLLNNPQDVNMGDVEIMIETALSFLPDSNGPDFDAMDQFDRDANSAVRKLLLQQQALTAIVDAMAQAVRPDITLGDLNAVANTIHESTALLPDGPRHWEEFCAAIQARGLLVAWIDLGNGLLPRPEIHTPESLRKARRAWRKMDAGSRAIRRQAAEMQNTNLAREH